MSLKILKSLCRAKLINNSRNYSDNPFKRTWKLIAKEVPEFLGINKKAPLYPEHADVVIIGGGPIGASVAYWLKMKAGDGLAVVVLEQDPTYQNMQKNLTLGTLTQHYSLPENMHLSQYSADFLRNARQHLDGVDVEFYPHGHLVLACDKYAHRLEQNVAIQREYGVRNELLSVEDIKQRYPWINTADVELGCIGTESEGTFNAWAFLKGLINKSQKLGAMYVHAEVVGFELEDQPDALIEGVKPGSYQRVYKVLYKTPEGDEYAIKFAACILAAGHNSAEIAKLAKIGTGEGLLSIPLPINKREHKVFSIQNSAKTTGLHTPIITDTSGLWLMRNGLDNDLLCGHVPLPLADSKEGEDYVNEVIKPSLVNRIPDCKDAKISGLATEVYDYNTYDDTGILGPHPYHNNLFIASGFGKNACAHAPALGRAIAESIIDSNYATIDLTRFTFDRVLTSQPMLEFNIY